MLCFYEIKKRRFYKLAIVASLKGMRGKLMKIGDDWRVAVIEKSFKPEPVLCRVAFGCCPRGDCYF
jgi:hypothetical protein